MEGSRLPHVDQPRRHLPAGRLTFLLTDIEGSTRLFRALGHEYVDALHVHRAVISRAVAEHDGIVVSAEGDAVFAVFTRAAEALSACAQAQRSLADTAWPRAERLTVRMGLHTADAAPFGGDYVSLAVHQAARVMSAGHGEQVLYTEATAEAAAGELPAPLSGEKVGVFALRDFESPSPLFQLVGPGLRRDFPPVRADEQPRHNLPRPRMPYIGREAELRQVASDLRSFRLVTVLGTGGLGKTRLAVEVASRASELWADGARFVPLAEVSDPAQVVAVTLAACGVQAGGRQDPLDVLYGFLRDRRVLLVVDNCEHVLAAISELVAELLTRCSGLTVLATSRSPLRVEGERLVQLQPLDVTSAVAFLVDRARAAGASIADDDESYTAAREVCRRLDGMPLALELVASRVPTMSLGTLTALLDAGPLERRGGTRRQRSIDETIAWSWQLVDDDAKVAWQRLSLLSAGFALPLAVAVVAGALGDAPAAAAVAALVEASVLTPQPDSPGIFRMLEPLRQHGLSRMSSQARALAHHDLRQALLDGLDVSELWESDAASIQRHRWDILAAADLRPIDRETAERMAMLVATMVFLAPASTSVGAVVRELFQLAGGASDCGVAAAVRCASALRMLQSVREGERILDELRQRPLTPEERFEVAVEAVNLASWRGSLAEVAERVRIARALQPPGKASSMLDRREVELAWSAGDLDRATALLTELRAQSGPTGWPFDTELALVLLARGELDAARSVVEQLAAQAPGPGSFAYVRLLEVELALACEEGDLQAASALCREALDYVHFASWPLWHLAFMGELIGIRYELGEIRAAAQLTLDSLALRDQLGEEVADGDFFDLMHVAASHPSAETAALAWAQLAGRAPTTLLGPRDVVRLGKLRRRFGHPPVRSGDRERLIARLQAEATAG